MKTFVRRATMLMAIAAMCQAGTTLAEDLHYVSDGSQAITLVGDQKTEPCATGCAEPSCEDPCGGGCCCKLGCDGCYNYGIVGFAGLDSFKGISDGSRESNFGAVSGVNSALLLPTDYNLGWQLGMSYGVYDFDGWGQSVANNRSTSQQQIFITTGFFHKPDEGRRLSYGLVYDWMINDSWGVYGTSPTLGQWRGQVEYALSGCNSVGVWGCVNDRYSQQTVVGTIAPLAVRTAAVTQANLFWHHKFCSGADSWLYVGIPERSALTGDGSLGQWMVGANVQVPLSDRLALYANGSYFRPTASAGGDAAMSQGYDVSMGVAWYFGHRAVNHAINGDCGLPYMPVANNSNFLVDQNFSF